MKLFPLQAGAAMRALDFYAKFGVNGNLQSGGSPAAEIADMNYVGIKNIRTGAPAASWIEWASAISAAGIRQMIDLEDNAPFGAVADWLTALKANVVKPYGANMVTAVAGPNEPDNQAFSYAGLTGIPAANKVQKDLYAAMKADPALAGIPVAMYPLAFPNNYPIQQQVGDMSAFCDLANLHDYYLVDNNTAVVRANGPIYQQLDDYLAAEHTMANKPAFITSETGYGSVAGAGFRQSADERTQARLILCDLFDHAARPDCRYVYIFTLRWGPETQDWGLMNDDGTPKQSGTAVHNLMALLDDPGPLAASFTPGRLPYALSGMPASSGNFALAKSDGSFLILLWNETPIWDIAGGAPVTIPTSTVTAALPAGSSGSVFDPINQGTTAISTFANAAQVQVGLNDAPLIIKVNPR